ncbi:hypothetical protein BJX64DRAFT_289064 [Aspergillus heterothallicus]
MADEDPAVDFETKNDLDDSEDSAPVAHLRRSIRHDMSDLEFELNRIMVTGCKIDACIDLFIARVLSLVHNQQDPTVPKDSWTTFFEAMQKLPDKTFRPIENELRRNIDRLLPGYVHEETRDIMERVKTRLSDRVTSMELGRMGTNRSKSDAKRKRQWELEEGDKFGGTESSTTDELSPASIDTLRDLVNVQQSAASFSCGGMIPIVRDTPDATTKNRSASPPVSIFWGDKHDGSAHKLVLPIDTFGQGVFPNVLQRLVADCEPASFGIGQQDVIDLGYRQAGKLDVQNFATSFHPADFGILDHVGQILLPRVISETDNQLQSRRIKAELYKLNVYSGPSGLFRKHVDTPRATNQIGSLVVCLPSKFTGGNLNVEHNGKRVTFDWSEKSDTAIQWAAFYSDCEHEIERTTQGDRITLTYNLFVTDPIGEPIPGPSTVIDPRTLSTYVWMKDLLAQDDFMKRGGILGFYCSHAYPHSSSLAYTYLPESLKGADLVLYSVFQSLGIELAILPIIHSRDSDYGGGRHVRWDYLRTHCEPIDPVSFTVDKCADIDLRWKRLLEKRQRPVFTNRDGDDTKLGHRRHSYSSGWQYEDESEAIHEEWPFSNVPGITWITHAQYTEMAFSYVAYGNEASISTLYSSVAILAVVPPSDDRRGHFV